MLLKHKYKGRNEYIDAVSNLGVTDYVKNGVIYENNVTQSVMVESSSDLADLSGYSVGSIAYTAGFGSMWQLDADGE